MGGSAAQHNNFWQVFVRPGQAGAWKLATPLGVASNGGITVAAEGGPALAAAIRPSQDLSFSPLASSSDNGAKWAQAGLLDAPLAAGPGRAGGRARRRADRADQDRRRGAQGRTRGRPGPGWPASTRWPRPAGRGCLPAQLTSVAYSPSGAPLVAGACTRAGQAGIFRLAGGRWSPIGPALPAALARQDVEVLQMAPAGHAVAALLAAGRGPADPAARGVVQPGRHLVDACPALPGRRGRARGLRPRSSGPAVRYRPARLAGRPAVRAAGPCPSAGPVPPGGPCPPCPPRRRRPRTAGPPWPRPRAASRP